VPKRNKTRWAVGVLLLVLGCDQGPGQLTDAVLPFLDAPETRLTDAEMSPAVLSATPSKPPAAPIWAPDSRKKGPVPLIGTYSCELRSEELPLGPFVLPRFGCRIFKDKTGGLIVETIRGMASLDGMIRKTADGGFRVIGHFRFPGHQLRIDVEMSERSDKRGRYEGMAAGRLSSNKRKLKNYSLVMAKV
jgi:hypothetical protein